MRQTNHYKLNLIDAMDTFSPAPLNENAELLEQALDAVHAEAAAGTAAETQARAAADSALASRVAALEGHRFAAGSYTGKGTKSGDYQTIKVGFTPKAVFVVAGGEGISHFSVTGQSTTSVLEIVSGGFRAYGFTSSSGTVSGTPTGRFNANGATYRYVAIC